MGTALIYLATAGACRSITCMALDDGAVLVQLSRALFLAFLASRPNALQIYLQQGVARLWRVAKFILSDYLNLPLPLTAAPPSTAQYSEQPRRTSDASPTRCSPTQATAGSAHEATGLDAVHSDCARRTDGAPSDCARRTDGQTSRDQVCASSQAHVRFGVHDSDDKM